MKLFSALALLLLPAAFAGTAHSIDLSSPIVLWSNKAVLREGKQVSYQVLPNAEVVVTDFVLGAFGKTDSEDRLQGDIKVATIQEESSTVVVFIGSQLDVADMRGRTGAVKNLDTIVHGAVSSLVMPYTMSQGASIQEAVCTKLDRAGVQHEVVGCSLPSTDLKADVAAILAKGGSRAVIVCSNVDSTLLNTNAGLAVEVEQLMAVQSAVDAAGGSHVMLYTSQTKSAGTGDAAGARRRSLLEAPAAFSGFGNYTVCGPLCQTQVRWLEGMLAALVLALASCAGLVCLYVLDTPTRFESPKETAPQQS